MIKKFEEYINEGIITKTIKRSLGNGIRKEDDITPIIKDFMEKHNITDYTINPDKSVDVNVEVKIEEEDLINGKLPFKFSKAYDGFDCCECGLTTLENCPDEVYRYFDCSDNNLTSLEGAPKIINGSFYCGYNKLTTLEGCPEKIKNRFFCSGNELTSLKGCPEEVEYFECDGNQLTSLEGCPKRVGGHFNCENNKKQFTIKEVEQYCNVEKNIFV